MTRAWIGIALLAGSWLPGLEYFQPASGFSWAVLVAAGTVCLCKVPVLWPGRTEKIMALVLCLPAVCVMPIPYKAIPILLAAGLFLKLAPIPRRWPRMLAGGAIVSGTVLTAQSLVLLVYEVLTARSHELPWPLNELVGVIPRLMGIDSVVDGSVVAMRSVSDVQRISATWELLLDPATVCFVVGGMVALGLACHATYRVGTSRTTWPRSCLVLLTATLTWAVIRVALLIAIILHRTLRADAAGLPNVADVLVNSWLHIGLLAGLVILAARFVPVPADTEEQLDADGPANDTAGPRGPRRWHRFASPIMVGTGVALLVALFFWDPVGKRKAGRVMIVERHSTWEPTTEPYGTRVYGEAGSYNYAAAYAYCQQHYQMSRLLEAEPINDETLGRCDVLVIKTPTARYSKEEVNAVVRFVEQGGSLLMIGDHTNVFNMNTYLNDIARHFGFTFRNDLLFRVGDPYKQRYRRPLIAHPIVQRLPRMNFAVSCSIDPGRSAGRMIIRSTGLWNLPPAYQESNYHPQAEYRSWMQYGAWCQLWSTCYGSGRVLAFADSTLFSNFCTFQPGKTELLVGMLEWLNHGSVLDRRAVKLAWVVPWLAGGGLLLVLGIWLGRRKHTAWLVLVGVALAGWSVAALAVIGVNRTSMPISQAQRLLPHVVIDRTLSEVPLFTGAFHEGEEGVGYGMLEQWIPRVGNSISRRSGEEAFLGDALVIICPTRSVSSAYRDRLIQFVDSGGHVLVVDSIDVEGSTANSVLWPFGLASNHNVEQPTETSLRWSSETPEVPLQGSCAITGGETLARWGGIPVAARARYGQGTVTAIGFGSLFNDANMGFHWLPEPEPDTLNRYEVLYGILRDALPGKPQASQPDPSS